MIGQESLSQCPDYNLLLQIRHWTQSEPTTTCPSNYFLVFCWIVCEGILMFRVLEGRHIFGPLTNLPKNSFGILCQAHFLRSNKILCCCRRTGELGKKLSAWTGTQAVLGLLGWASQGHPSTSCPHLTLLLCHRPDSALLPHLPPLWPPRRTFCLSPGTLSPV